MDLSRSKIRASSWDQRRERGEMPIKRWSYLHVLSSVTPAFFRSRLYDDERNFQLRSKMALAPLAPYPTVSVPFPSPATGAQSQLVCSGCQNLLLYPVGATSVCCAVCNAVTSAPPPGAEMAQLVCGGCHTLLMYIRGATSVQCSCCHTVNLALEANQVAHVNCGNCRMLLMYQYGAPSVKCAVCNFVTSILASTDATEQKFNS